MSSSILSIAVMSQVGGLDMRHTGLYNFWRAELSRMAFLALAVELEVVACAGDPRFLAGASLCTDEGVGVDEEVPLLEFVDELEAGVLVCVASMGLDLGVLGSGSWNLKMRWEISWNQVTKWGSMPFLRESGNSSQCALLSVGMMTFLRRWSCAAWIMRFK